MNNNKKYDSKYKKRYVEGNFAKLYIFHKCSGGSASLKNIKTHSNVVNTKLFLWNRCSISIQFHSKFKKFRENKITIENKIRDVIALSQKKVIDEVRKFNEFILIK